MKGLILALILTLVGGQHHDQQADLNQNTCLSYQYVAEVLTALPEKEVANGIQIKCNVKIGDINPQHKFMLLHCPEVSEYKGTYPDGHFAGSPKMTESLKELRDQMITFQYAKGSVGNIMADRNLSEDMLNFIKGILSLLPTGLKEKETQYRLIEYGVQGRCNSTVHVSHDDKKADEILMTKYRECDESVSKVFDAAYFNPCKLCQQTSKNVLASSTSKYKIKLAKEEYQIIQVDVLETHQFLPYSESNGGAITQARQQLMFTDKQACSSRTPSNLENRGSLQYIFNNEAPPLPARLFKKQSHELETQMKDNLKYLADHRDKIPSDTRMKLFLETVQYMRMAKNESYFTQVFREYSDQPNYRRVFLDLLPAAGTPSAVNFLKHNIEKLTFAEALQMLLLCFHSANPRREVVDALKVAAEKYLERRDADNFSRKTVCLGYATLLNRHCSVADTCPPSLIETLAELANRIRMSDVERNILLLKCYGNVGNPVILKRIKKFLPQYEDGRSASNLPFRVQANALLALRPLAKKDPKLDVQRILLPIVLNHKLNPVLRNLGVMALFEMSISLPMCLTVAYAMVEEPSMQVEHFVYSHLEALARSTDPHKHIMVSAARMALKVWRPKLHQSSKRLSRVFLNGIFKGDVGVESKVAILNSEGSMLPRAIMTNIKAMSLGNVIPLLEVSVANEGVNRLLGRARSAESVEDAQLSGQKMRAQEDPVVGGYLKIADQEMLYGTLDYSAIQYILQVLTGQAKPSRIKVIPRNVAINWDNHLIGSEISYSVPTCTGIPVQYSMTVASRTKVDGSVDLSISPRPKGDLALSDLMSSNIKLYAKLDPKVDSVVILAAGINTPQIQVMLETHNKITANIPIDVHVAANIAEKKFELQTPPCKQKKEIISVSSKTSAVSRSIEDTKSSYIHLFEAEPSDSSSAESIERANSRSSEMVSSENYQSGKPTYHSSSDHEHLCFEACTFGCKVCAEWSSENARCPLDDPLFNILSPHNWSLTIQQARTEATIQNLKFWVQGGAQAQREASTQSMEASQREEASQERKVQDKGPKRNIDDSNYNDEGENQEEANSNPSSYEDTKHGQRGGDRKSGGRKSGDRESAGRRSGQRERGDRRSVERESGDRESGGRRSGERGYLRSGGRRSGERESGGRRSGERESGDRERSGRESGGRERGSRESGGRSRLSSFSRSNEENRRSSGEISDESYLSQKIKFTKDRKSAFLTIVAEADMGNQKQGYQYVSYLKTEENKLHLHIAADVIRSTRWNGALDVIVSPSELQASMCYGDNCQDYRFEVKTFTGQSALRPSAIMKMKWKAFPDYSLMEQKPISWAAELLPDVAYIVGSLEGCRKDSSQELVLKMIETAPYTANVFIQVHGKIIYKDTVCIPFSLPTGQHPHHQISNLLNSNNFAQDIISLIAKGDQAVCEMDEKKVITFDNKIINYHLSEYSQLQVVKDCVKSAHYKPRFSIWTVKPDLKIPMQVHINTSSSHIKIFPSSDSHPHVSINDQPILVDKKFYKDETENITIYANDTAVAIEVPQLGLDNVTYDSDTLRVTVAPRMRGHTCGLCGDNNGEIRNEGQMPNRELAHNDAIYVRSWALADSADSDSGEIAGTIPPPDNTMEQM